MPSIARGIPPTSSPRAIASPIRPAFSPPNTLTAHRPLCGTDRSIERCAELRLPDQPVEALDLFPGTQDKYGGQALDAEPLGHRHVAFEIHAIHPHLAHVLLGHTLQA